MDTISQLQAMGLTLPTPMYLVGVVIFGIVGLWAFHRGRKAGRPRTRWIGLALMLYPYVVPQTWLLYLLGSGLCAGLWLDRPH